MPTNLDQFEQLLVASRGKVHGYLYRMGVPLMELEDLVQEVMFRAYRGREGFDTSRAFLPWLFTIARNERARFYSRLQAKHEFGRPSVEEEESPENLVENLIRKESHQEVRSLVEQLQPQQKEALILKHFSNLTFKEVAHILNLPESTVKSHVYQALKALTRSLL